MLSGNVERLRTKTATVQAAPILRRVRGALAAVSPEIDTETSIRRGRINLLASVGTLAGRIPYV